MSALAALLGEPVEREVDHRGGVEGQELRNQQPADDGDAEGPAKLGPCSEPDGELRFEHDPVLVQLGESSRHLPLAEGTPGGSEGATSTPQRASPNISSPGRAHRRRERQVLWPPSQSERRPHERVLHF